MSHVFLCSFPTHISITLGERADDSSRDRVNVQPPMRPLITSGVCDVGDQPTACTCCCLLGQPNEVKLLCTVRPNAQMKNARAVVLVVWKGAAETSNVVDEVHSGRRRENIHQSTKGNEVDVKKTYVAVAGIPRGGRRAMDVPIHVLLLISKLSRSRCAFVTTGYENLSPVWILNPPSKF